MAQTLRDKIYGQIVRKLASQVEKMNKSSVDLSHILNYAEYNKLGIRFSSHMVVLHSETLFSLEEGAIVHFIHQVQIQHPTHKTMPISPGIYQVRKQQEIDPDTREIDSVQD